MGGARGSVLVTAGGHQGHVANQPECKGSGFPGIVNNPASLENLLHGNGFIIARCAAWATWQERNLQLCVDCLPARWTRNLLLCFHYFFYRSATIVEALFTRLRLKLLDIP